MNLTESINTVQFIFELGLILITKNAAAILMIEFVLIVLGVYCYRRRRKTLLVLIAATFLIYTTIILKSCFSSPEEHDYSGYQIQCCYVPPPYCIDILHILLPWNWGGS